MRTRCLTSRRWSGWPATISGRRLSASPSPRPWCAASRGTSPAPWATSGSIWYASITTCCCRSAWCSRCSSFPRASRRISIPMTRRNSPRSRPIQVPKDRREQQPGQGRGGQRRFAGSGRRDTEHRRRPHRLADGDQDARHERRRLRQRQRLAPVSRTRPHFPTSCKCSRSSPFPSALTYYLGRMP